MAPLWEMHNGTGGLAGNLEAIAGVGGAFAAILSAVGSLEAPFMFPGHFFGEVLVSVGALMVVVLPLTQSTVPPKQGRSTRPASSSRPYSPRYTH